MIGFDPAADGVRKLTTVEHSGAGVVSGLLTRIIIQPLDVVKIRFQLQVEPIGTLSGARSKYRGFVQAIRRIISEEGIGALWKGHVPAQGLSGIYGLVQFTTFEKLSELSYVALAKHNFSHSQKNHWVDFACGAMAGCCATAAAMPMDVIRTRLVAQGEPKFYLNTRHAVFTMWKHEGCRSYFKGLVPSLIQVAPYSGLQFALYRSFIGVWSRFVPGHDSFGALVTGALAGCCAKTVMYPLDMIRHRVQIVGFEKGRIGFGRSHKVSGMLHSFTTVIRHEGVRGLFKGLLASVIKASASTGFAFLFYQWTCNLIRKHRHHAS